MCLSHLIYTVWPCLFHTCHAAPMPFFSRPRHSTAVESGHVDYLLAFGFLRLPRGVPRSSNQMHTNLRCRWPVWNQTPFVMDEEKSGSSTLAVRIFPAAMRTFTKDTALWEQGRGAAWHVRINARHGRGTACYVWIGLNRIEEVLCLSARQQNLQRVLYCLHCVPVFLIHFLNIYFQSLVLDS